jgi:predicted dienelactone hydrolase
MVQVWYPAANEDGKSAQYMPALDVAGPVIAEQFDLPAFLLNHINLTDLDVWLDVPPAENGAPFPVIIFSHGLTGIRVQNTVMVRELVSHGYIVAAIDHSYGNALTIFPDGRIFVYDPTRLFPSGDSTPEEANPLVQVWANDIAFVLDEIALWDEETGHVLNGRFDLGHIGIFGHSTGGGAAMALCSQDARCQAAVGLDSWLLPISQDLLAQSPNQPIMFISTPSWLGQNNRALGNRLFTSLNQDGYNLTLANTAHYDFTDLPLLTPLTPQLDLSGSINSSYSLSIQNEYVLAFFDQYLKAEPSSLLQTEPSPYPELTIVRNLRP